MSDSQPNSASGRFVKPITLVIAAVVVGACAGMVAAILQVAGFALVGLQSIAIGALLAVLLIGTAATFSTRRPRWSHVLLAASVAVAVQHAWLYKSAIDRRQQAVAKQPAIELFRPRWSEQTLLEYMRAEATPRAVGLWVLDACLLMATAVVIVELSRKQ